MSIGPSSQKTHSNVSFINSFNRILTASLHSTVERLQILLHYFDCVPAQSPGHPLAWSWRAVVLSGLPVDNSCSKTTFETPNIKAYFPVKDIFSIPAVWSWACSPWWSFQLPSSRIHPSLTLWMKACSSQKVWNTELLNIVDEYLDIPDVKCCRMLSIPSPFWSRPFQTLRDKTWVKSIQDIATNQ